LFDAIGGRFVEKGPHLFARGIDAADVLRFIESYPFHPADAERFANLVPSYVRSQLNEGELDSWTVALIGRANPRTTRPIGGRERPLLDRSRLARQSPATAYLGGITSDADLNLGLPVFDPADQEARTRLRKAAGPLLLLYPIAKDSKPAKPDGVRLPLEAVDDLLGVAFVFPEATKATLQEYVTVDLKDVYRELEETPPDEPEAA
jgi:hypothetical protein